jgi:hypothetical protein
MAARRSLRRPRPGYDRKVLVRADHLHPRRYGEKQPIEELPLPRISLARQIPASLRQKFNLQQQPLLSLEFTAAVA